MSLYDGISDGITIGEFEFDGPFHIDYPLVEGEGLYALLYLNEGNFELLELGGSENLYLHLKATDIEAEWPEIDPSMIYAATFQTPETTPEERSRLLDSVNAAIDERSPSGATYR